MIMYILLFTFMAFLFVGRAKKLKQATATAETVEEKEAIENVARKRNNAAIAYGVVAGVALIFLLVVLAMASQI